VRLSDIISSQSTGFFDFNSHVFNLALLSFVLVYSIFSFLVILFNLPTSSVFEQKLEEVMNFQRISQSIQTEQNEESVYNILLESSVSTVFADAAWLDIQSANDGHKLYTYRISERESQEIREHLKNHHVVGALEQSSDRTRNLSKHLASLKGSRFRSLLAFPIIVKSQTIGTLALLKELPDGFNKEMTRIVSTFSNQAGISIENFRLMEEAFQNERYKEELKIAKAVQKSLLPQTLEKDPDFEISSFAESADEVGGDYYDTLRINEHKVALIIADVSGKGTTAAFHMSQMKGIFHSLAQDELDPKIFMERANRALAFCLERGSFISASFFIIDTQNKLIRYSRAGHCPVLYYNAETRTASYLKDKGAALGMVRNKGYCHLVETRELAYQSGDIMFLYTDGITEAKDSRGEEFGYERLANAFKEVTDSSAQEIEKHVIDKLYEFSGTREINDDYTSMTIKFNQRTEQ
jgi:serine phosphatase RsbU (regulator of sigma subunit)